ncbi:MAG: hypothetical protein KDC26_07645 [Armatimonadetes bacterium]|nr:hypothetical protein [Armatimonadota bacterium]
MALKKRYYSLNGQILGEHDVSSGQTLQYARDALGNVRKTIDSDTGNVVHSYIYKPWGEIWQASGTGATSRRFCWIGSWGYANTNRHYQFNSYYVRARHYSGVMGAWITRDPLWPTEMPYGYGEGRVYSGIDYDGTQFLNTSVKVAFFGQCCKQIIITTSGASHGVFSMGSSSCEWKNTGNCRNLQSEVEKCPYITWEGFCEMLEKSKCCSIAKQLGADPYSVCTTAITERSRRNVTNGIQDYYGSAGVPLSKKGTIKTASVGCIQVQVQTANLILDQIVKCSNRTVRGKLLRSLFPIPATDELLLQKLSTDCEWSLKLLAALNVLVKSGCASRFGKVTKTGESVDYMKPESFPRIWNVGSGPHKKATECLYSILKKYNICG